ncbi:GNAT family N-acetyltransferase [Nisaea acidiphila]|uniref:GNAT family N-acetyltransferase n=1 Tax=Nisaea acidiphila TaxID=1862145 RepID=A0A9J7ANW5_9PROT|nr:GNAT family N-acetyltransferase [Nisaea acidiphila]UUX49323.1 GNAT family N-acetyltransferase [Nisaea acidiphila]
MTDLTVNVVDGETDGLYELDQRLVAFNRERSDWGSRYFTVEIRDADNGLRGGAGARVNLGVVEVSTLWLDGELRGGGTGRHIVDAVIAEGRRLGASRILLDTYDFQARDFYEALGFTVFGTLDYPSGNSRFYLSRDI